jgi:tetratricopeptide (TPR) repeat protein
MLEASKKILRLKPDLAFAHVDLIISLSNLGRHEEVVAAIQEAIALNSDEINESAYQYLGDSLLELGRFQEALDAYEKTFEFNLDAISDPDIYEKMVSALLKLNRNEEAEKYSRKAKKVAQENADVLPDLTKRLEIKKTLNQSK